MERFNLRYFVISLGLILFFTGFIIATPNSSSTRNSASSGMQGKQGGGAQMGQPPGGQGGSAGQPCNDPSKCPPGCVCNQGAAPQGGTAK